MRSPGILLLTEPLLFLVWRELLHRFDVFTSANFAQWVFSVAGVQIMIRIAAVLGLLVAPGVGVIGWVSFDETSMVIPNALLAMCYPVWLYLDLRRGFSRWLAKEGTALHLLLIITMCSSYIILTNSLLYGVRYYSLTSISMGIIWSCLVSFFAGQPVAKIDANSLSQD